jgi:hypothetical protein
MAYATAAQPITVGVDTHLEVHVAHANDQLGRRVGTRSVPTTPTGYQDLLARARRVRTSRCWTRRSVNWVRVFARTAVVSHRSGRLSNPIGAAPCERAYLRLTD